MDDNVVSIEESQPHMTITLPDAVHVVPVQLLRRIAKGDVGFEVLPDEAWRVLLGDFLVLIEEDGI